MNAIGILAIVVTVISLYFLILPYLKKGGTESLFLIEDGNELFALVLMNIELIVMSKRGSYIIHRYRLKKVNIRTGEVIFNVHYKKIVASLLQSYARILGCNSKYAYLTSKRKDLTVFDITTGKKIADQKFFKQKGIDISGQDWKFDHTMGALLVYDNQGIQYAINGQEIVKTNSFQSDIRSATVYNVFESLHFTDHGHFMMHIRQSLDPENPMGKRIELKEIQGTKRSYIHVSDFFDATEPDLNHKDSFIKPVLLRLDKDHFLVKHQQTMDDHKKDIFLSKVNFDSKEIWKRHKKDVAITSIGDHRFKFYISPYKGQLIITWIDTGAKEFSISMVADQTGEVLMKPVYFKNKKVK